MSSSWEASTFVCCSRSSYLTAILSLPQVLGYFELDVWLYSLHTMADCPYILAFHFRSDWLCCWNPSHYPIIDFRTSFNILYMYHNFIMHWVLWVFSTSNLYCLCSMFSSLLFSLYGVFPWDLHQGSSLNISIYFRWALLYYL